MQARPNAIVDKETGKIFVQTPLPPFNCLALEGGGVACAGHIGAIEVMEKTGVLDDVKYVSGISGGALAALAICLGYSSEEISKMLSEIPMDQFMEQSDSWSWTPTIFSNIRKAVSVWTSPLFALSSGKVFLSWVQKIVKDKMGDENATFGDLIRKIEEEEKAAIMNANAAAGVENAGQDQSAEPGDDHASKQKPKMKRLYIGGTQITIGIPEVKIFSAETTPDMPLAYAPFISALYPVVFSPFKYNGHLWGDGGIKSVLLTKIFDNRRFLPEGYDFNEKGINPGVLAIKVDSQEEIDQIIWGIHKEVKITKTTEYLYQVANAASHNTDIAEIREARTTIPLADAGVDRLDMTIPKEMTQRLVQTARDTTIDFFENYIDAAYGVMKYDSIQEWLAKQTIDEIKNIKRAYEAMLGELAGNLAEVEARAKLAEFDPSRPSIDHLQVYIKFLQDYIKLRTKVDVIDDNMIQFPANHINLPPQFPRSAWHQNIKKELKERLDSLCMKIESAEAEYQRYLDDLDAVMRSDKVGEQYKGIHDERVQTIALYYEYLSKLREQRNNVEFKLGIKSDYHAKASEENSDAYAQLYKKLATLNEMPNLSPSLRAVMLSVTPSFTYETNQAAKIDHRLDLRIPSDRKLYLIAALMYLQKQKRPCPDITLFYDIFRAYFPNEEPPNGTQDLMRLLGEEGAALQISMFRLENLLHYFEKKERPTYKPVMDIEGIFSTSKAIFFASVNKETDQAIEMQAMNASGDGNSNLPDLHMTTCSTEASPQPPL